MIRVDMETVFVWAKVAIDQEEVPKKDGEIL